MEGVSIDSRTIESGNLFVPLVAERDGHDFVDQALAAGASAYLTSNEEVDLARQREDTPRVRVGDTVEALAAIGRLARSKLTGAVIGITGSVGKTSVKDLTRAACTIPGGPAVWASRRSFNNELGVPLTLANAPDGAGTVVVEMGARGRGHIAELCEIAKPTIGMVTTVALAHSELFGSIEAVAQCKGELIESLPADGVAILNADNPHVAAMAQRSKARVITFGFAGNGDRPAAARPDIAVDDIRLDGALHPSFNLLHGDEVKRISVPVAGAHMAVNAAAAVAAAVASGVAFGQAARQVSAVEMSPWRMEVSTTPGGATIINDAYNANPTSMRAALATLSQTGAERLIAVVGEMAELGDEGPAEHRAIAAEATSAGVRVIAVSCPAYGPGALHVADIDEALAAIGTLDPTCAVLIKGSRVVGLERLAARLTSAVS
ncbi:MAG: UDP-N-acetylmuramoyl-tripeptide--D-alanyl-D-alanine ligase [Acidimicrobiia bacterium]|nr:UDP-N-acetylmuramoyl-tripeptide--D-alanyl-D-alanine ligase [Acidimicrobiia bacterium]